MAGLSLVPLLAAVAILLLATRADATNFTTGTEPATQFGVHQVSFTGNGGVADPFATAATVTFTPPSGAANAKTVEMFWDGGNTWRARAYVTEIGNWTWTSSCTNDSGLDGKTGAFSAVSSSLRGKLKPHPSNPRALVTDNGQWFAPIGDTAYYMLGSSAYQDYVADDWAHGVNFLRCSAFGHLRDFTAHFTAASPSGIPNLASLQSDDTKLQWLFENYPGTYLQYIMFPENPAASWTNYSTTARNELIQQMMARCGVFPSITWLIMNDATYPTDGSGNTAVATEVSSFLVAHDVYGHLRGTGATRGSGAPFAGSAWTTFLHFETLDSVAAPEADSNASYGKFTWCGEDRYETYRQPTYPQYFYRRLMWAWLLSGGSACYGGDWSTTTPYGTTTFVGLNSVQYIKGYFESRSIDLGLFAYNDSLANDALATGTDRPQVCNRGASEYIIYHPNSTNSAASVNVNPARTVSFDLNLSAAAGTFQVEWFRCLDGVVAAGSPVQGGAVRTLTAPWTGQDVVCRLTGGTNVVDTIPPSTPTNLTATAISQSVIALAWNASTDNVGVAGYYVYRDGTNAATVAGTSYTDMGLAASTLFSYSVVAFDFATNTSLASAVASATTLAPDTQAPSVPTNVTATALSSSSILVAWSASTDNVGVAGYELYRDGLYVDSVVGTNYTDSGLAASTSHTYSLAAFDAAGNISAASAPAGAVTLAPAPVLVAEPFDYPVGANLNTLNSGTGWGGPWVVGYNSSYPATIYSGNLGSYPGLSYSGNSLQFWARGNGSTWETLVRSFAASITDQGQTVWFSLVVGLCNAKDPATWSLTGLTADAAGTIATNLFSFGATSPATFKFGNTILFTGDANWTPHLALVRIQMSGDANAETLTAYCDPNLSANPSTWSGVTNRNLYANSGLTGFSYGGVRNSTATLNTQFFVDEIRLASTWQAAVGYAVTAPRITDIHLASPTSLTLQWQSVSGTTYKIQAATNLLTGFQDTSQTNIVATNSTTSRTVTIGPAPLGFYRVGALQ